jgi:hypothetical protein
MKNTLKTLAAAWLVSVVSGAGCFCGAVAAGALSPKVGATATAADYEFVQAQVYELAVTLDRIERDRMYDSFAANPIDEFAGLE